MAEALARPQGDGGKRFRQVELRALPDMSTGTNTALRELRSRLAEVVDAVFYADNARGGG